MDKFGELTFTSCGTDKELKNFGIDLEQGTNFYMKGYEKE
jgi:hypothetical protein